VEPWLLRRERIRDHMRRGEGSPGECLLRPFELARFAHRVFADVGQLDRQDGVALHACNLGTSIHFFCFQLFSPSSASWTPFAPSSRPQRYLPSPATWRRKSSHCALKALS